VNIKPSRHRFGFSLAWDWQYVFIQQAGWDNILVLWDVADILPELTLTRDEYNDKNG
jgi:hypothetical protein